MGKSSLVKAVHEDVHELSKQALVIETHYGRPMDIEWAKDGVSGKLLPQHDVRGRVGLLACLRMRRFMASQRQPDSQQ